MSRNHMYTVLVLLFVRNVVAQNFQDIISNSVRKPGLPMAEPTDMPLGPSRRNFYRMMGASVGTRRMFGGSSASIAEWPSACALGDMTGASVCSGSIITPQWVLTAGHCIHPRVQRIMYNSNVLSSPRCSVALVDTVYRHPEYKVQYKDEGYGTDVVGLVNDIGLVKTKTNMTLIQGLPVGVPHAVEQVYYPFFDLLTLADKQKMVKVFGFGRTEKLMHGESLVSVVLRMGACDRNTFIYCACGAAVSGRKGQGVCSGDSGGPVVHRGTLVGITSMGPVECTEGYARTTATSVFTSIRQYADMIRKTIGEKSTVEALDSNHYPPQAPSSRYQVIPVPKALPYREAERMVPYRSLAVSLSNFKAMFTRIFVTVLMLCYLNYDYMGN